MKRIAQTIDTIKYSYDPEEFFPVRVEGELINKSEFVKYKLKCFLVKKTLA